MKHPFALLMSLTPALLGAGCAHETTDRNGTTIDLTVPPSINRTVEQTGEEAKKAGKKALVLSKQAAQETVNAGKVVLNTAKIQSAIMGDNMMANAVIDVDTLPHNRVALRGRVHSVAQKQRAVQIAKAQAPGYTIVDQLQLVHGAHK